MKLDQLINKTQKQKTNIKHGYLNNSNLIIFAFSTVFYGRIFCSITNAPSIFSHAHFIVIPFVFWIVVTTSPIKNTKQLNLILYFLSGLYLLLTSILISAFLNEAGLINATMLYP